MNYGVLLSFVDFLKSAGNFILDLLIFALVLGIIVGIHELGHFIFARKANVLCREYAIGMGPKLWKKKKGETVYSLRAFPLGGFCAIAGEEEEPDPFKDSKQIKLNIVDGVVKAFYPEIDDESVAYPIYNIVSYDIYDEKQTGDLYFEVEKDGEITRYAVDPQAIIYTKKDEYQIAPYNRTLHSKGKGARALVMFGGPLMNFLLAIVVYFIAALFIGFAKTESNVLGGVSIGGSVSELYAEEIAYEDLNKIDLNKFHLIYTESIKETENIEAFKKEYLEKFPTEFNRETIYVMYKRVDFLKKGDVITALETKTLGKKNINSWDDLTVYLDEYDEKYLAEDVKIYYTRAGEEKSLVATPFIEINNILIGSGWNADLTGPVVINALVEDLYDSSRGLGDNTGLQLGDIILEIEGIKNPTWADVRKVFAEYVGGADTDEDYIDIVVKHSDGKEEPLKLKPYSKDIMVNQSSLSGEVPSITDAIIGISPETKFSFVKSIGYGFEKTWSAVTAVFKTFKLLFSNTVTVKNLSGPIGIFSITSQVRQIGFTSVLTLIGFLSVNIGLLNLLPIPALDGGRLVFVAYEAITKKKPNQKVETALITVTMLLLFGLIIFVSFNDVLRLLGVK